MKKTLKTKIAVGLFAFAFVAFFFTTTNVMSIRNSLADTYYYADDPAEQTFIVFAPKTKTWDVPQGSGNVWYDFSESQTLYNAFYSVCNSNNQPISNPTGTENRNLNIAFKLDFTGSWGVVDSDSIKYDDAVSDVGNGVYKEYGYFDFQFGFIDVSIQKDANQLKICFGGRYAKRAVVSMAGLSELTGKHQVNMIQRIIYSDAGRTSPVGLNFTVKIDNLFATYDYVQANLINGTSSNARNYGFYVRTEVNHSLVFCGTPYEQIWYYENDPKEQALVDFAPKIYQWDDVQSQHRYYDISYLDTIAGMYYMQDNGGSTITNSPSWDNRSLNLAFQLDFSGNWGMVNDESGYFNITFGFADLSIHKDTNQIKIGIGGRYQIIDTVEMAGLSDLTGLQKVNVIQKLICFDSDMTTPAGFRYVVKIGSLSCFYDYKNFPYQSTNLFRYSLRTDSDPVLFSGLSAVPKQQYTVTFITDDNVEAIAPVVVNAGSTVSCPELVYLNDDAVFIGFYIDGTDREFNFNAPVSSDAVIAVRFVDRVNECEYEDFTAFTYKEVYNAETWLKNGDTIAAGKGYVLTNGNTEVYAQEPAPPYNPSYSTGGLAFKVDLGNESYDTGDSFGWIRNSVYFRVLPQAGKIEIYIAAWNVNGEAVSGTIEPVKIFDLPETNLTGDHGFMFKAEWLYSGITIIGRRITVCVDGTEYEPFIIMNTQSANYRTYIVNNTSKNIVLKSYAPELYLYRLKQMFSENDYFASTWQIMENYMDETFVALNNAVDANAMQVIFDGAVIALNGYPNKEAEKVIAERRENEYTMFVAQYKEKDYSAEKWKEVQTLLEQARTEYAACLKNSEIETVTNKYAVLIGEIMPLNINDIKAAIITEIEAYVSGKNYSEENAVRIGNIIAEYKTLINETDNPVYLNALKESAIEELSEVQEDGKPTETDNGSGCGCSDMLNGNFAIVIASIFFALVFIKLKNKKGSLKK